MIVQCPNCQTRFRLDEEKVSSEQVKLRCSRCAHVFSLHHAPESEMEPREPSIPKEQSLDFDEPWSPQPPTEEAEQAEDDLAAMFPDEQEFSAQESVETVRADQESEEERPEASEAGDESGDVEEPGGQAPSLDMEEEPPSQSRRSSRKVLRIFLVLLLLAALAVAAYVLFPKYASYLPFTQGGSRSSDLGQKTVADLESVKDIALQDVRQYFVNNEKVGELFVIEGKAVNNFPSAKGLVKLEAELYDAQGQVVQSKRFLCGNTASLFQLQVLSREELNGVLQAKVGVLHNNTSVAPGSGVPFMVVFYNPPGAVQEFGLKVVETKDPPAQ